MRDNMMMVTTAQLPNYAETLENKGIQYLPKKQLSSKVGTLLTE